MGPKRRLPRDDHSRPRHGATDPAAASFCSHFLSSPTLDTVQLNVNVLEQGRRDKSLTVKMARQSGPDTLRALVKNTPSAPRLSHRRP